MEIENITFNTGIENKDLYLYSPYYENIVNDICKGFNSEEISGNGQINENGLTIIEYRNFVSNLMPTILIHEMKSWARAFCSECAETDLELKWRSNDKQILLLDATFDEHKFKVCNSKNYFNGIMTAVEFSLFLQILAFGSTAEKFYESKAIQNVLSYWWDRTRMVAYNSENGFNSSMLWSALD